MVSSTFTVAFQGPEARLVEVQCSALAGLPGFKIVGLADKAVTEARERIKAAFHALSLSLPARHITIHLAPADLPKEGPHFDLPIAIALLSELRLLDRDRAAATLSLGELALDARLIPVAGCLPAAVTAAEEGKALLVPHGNAADAAWVSSSEVYGADSLNLALRHLTGEIPLPRARAARSNAPSQSAAIPDMQEIRGQETAKRALEVAAAGGHNLLMTGPPGHGKSMLARAFQGLLPPLNPQEMLETALIRSIAGPAGESGFSPQPPFRDPHHSASTVALCGGGRRASPGEITLAHNGVLFLDELPEFAPQALESLRQPLESGELLISRAEARYRYPCRFQLIAAANPCRCGHAADPARACGRAPRCSEDYLQRISGPLYDRFDLRLEIPPLSMISTRHLTRGEPTAVIALRVARAREKQRQRYGEGPGRLNARASGTEIEASAQLTSEAQALLDRAAAHFGFSARGYHRILRVARSIADLEDLPQINHIHIGEAVGYRITGDKRL